jgi:ubiquinone/menaquinone biosynthesis C-methylase UbiE
MNEEKSSDKVHHHRGKSSEKFLDKDIILKSLDFFPGQTILDAGCGNGYMAKAFAGLLNKTGKVYALDPDRQAIAVLAEETKETQIIPLVGDIDKPTELKESTIDLIYISTVLHGFSKSQIEGFQKEIWRLLKPNGILAIVEIKKENTPFGPPLDMRFSPQELKELIPLCPIKTIEAGQFFYMQIFKKKE